MGGLPRTGKVLYQILRFERKRKYGIIYGVPKSANIHLIVGEDDFLVEESARKIVSKVVPEEFRASAVETVAGDVGNAEEQLRSIRECEASVQTPPFLDPVKLTWWRGVSFLPGGGRGGKISDDVKDALEKFAKGLAASPLPENQHLVITAPKLLATSIFAKTFNGFAETLVFASEARSGKRQAAALELLPDLAEAEGLSFAPGADQAFIAKAGADTRTIVSELAKLRTYLGGETSVVTAAHIAEITSPGGSEPELWEVTDAAGARNPARLMAVLRRLAAGGDKIGILLATVAEKFFRELIVYRDAIDHGWLRGGSWSSSIPENVRRQLDDAGVGPGAAKNPFAVRKASEHARNFTPIELRTARWRMLRARERLVSSEASDDAVSAELLRVIAPRRRAPAISH